MQRVDITWRHVLRVWFAFLWRATGAFFLLCGASFVTTTVLALGLMKFAGWSQAAAEHLLGPYYLAGLALALPFSALMAVRLLLKMKFAGLRLALVPDEPALQGAAGDDWMDAPQPRRMVVS
jgi:succinate dehydrogenase/fumarate reductase cytochrome b subunit